MLKGWLYLFVSVVNFFNLWFQQALIVKVEIFKY